MNSRKPMQLMPSIRKVVKLRPKKVPPIRLLPLVAVPTLAVAVLAGPQNLASAAEPEDTDLLCKATNSGGGPMDSYIVVGRGAVGPNVTDDEICGRFYTELDGAETGDLSVIAHEHFASFGRCGDSGATSSQCDAFGTRISAAEVDAASEANNLDTTCLGVMDDYYHPAEGTDCEPNLTLTTGTQ